MILLLLSHARPKIIKNFEIGFFESGASWLRRGQALERKPSNAWARKMPALTRPKNAVTVSIIAKIPCAPGPDRTTCDRAQSKGFRAQIEKTDPTDALLQQICRKTSPRANRLRIASDASISAMP